MSFNHQQGGLEIEVISCQTCAIKGCTNSFKNYRSVMWFLYNRTVICGYILPKLTWQILFNYIELRVPLNTEYWLLAIHARMHLQVIKPIASSESHWSLLDHTKLMPLLVLHPQTGNTLPIICGLAILKQKQRNFLVDKISLELH
jgi:hypothetical protein